MRPRRRVLTPSGWGVLALVAAGLLAGALVLLTGGCSAPEAESPIPTPVAPADVPRGTERRAERPEAIPPQAERYARTLARAWQYYFDLAEPASIGFAQVHQESRWKATARSPVGASGLGQFMPATADWIHELLPADVQAECGAARGCPEDPRWALEALARFDYLLHRGAVDAADRRERWAFALAGYNSGSGWVSRERARCRQESAVRPASMRVGPVVQAIVLGERHALQVGRAEVQRVVVAVVNEITPREAPAEQLDGDQAVHVADAPVSGHGGITVEQEHAALRRDAQGEEQAQALVVQVQDANASPCDPARWWGHVERVCLRRPEACRESVGYVKVIWERWRPLYAGWLGD